MDRPRAPSADLVISAADLLFVEALDDAEDGLSVRELPEDASYHFRLGFVYLHQSSGGFFLAPIIEAYFLRRSGFESKRALSHEVPLVLSALHAPQGLLPQVSEKPLVDHPL